MSKQERARVMVALTYHEETKALDVFLGDENPDFGVAKRVVEKGGMTVGVRQNGEPVFIRIVDAQTRTKTFQTIARRIADEKVTTDVQREYVVKYCLNETDKILELAKHRRAPMVARFVLSSLPA